MLLNKLIEKMLQFNARRKRICINRNFVNFIVLSIFGSFMFCTSLTWCYAATINAKSASYSDVASAITSASPGDTVIVPAGSVTWSSTLNITKGINLIGAGIGNTVITRGVSGSLITYIPANWDLNIPFRISGFSINMGDWSGSDIAAIVLGQNVKAAPYTAQTNIRIDNNRVYTGTVNQNAHFMIYRGAMYGVVDNNIVEGFTYMMRNINTASGSNWWDNRDKAGIGYNPGDQYVLIFEDNTFTFGSNWISNGITNSQFSGRYLLRYNTINPALDAWPLLDLHGYQYSEMHSSFGAEVYGNLIVGGSKSGSLYQTRGGKSLVFCNNWTGTGSPGISITTSAVSCPAAEYVELEMVNNSYFWGNRRNTTGGLVGSSLDDGGLSCGGRTRPAEGTDFFDDTTSSGVRCGTEATKPATCTVGQGYWATTQSCTNLTGMVGAKPTTPISGALYKCTAPNTWTEFYKPYTYPHPLRSGELPKLAAPAAPTGLKIGSL